MLEKKKHSFFTRVTHAAQSPNDWQGATQPPIFQTASYRHETAFGGHRSRGGHL